VLERFAARCAGSGTRVTASFGARGLASRLVELRGSTCLVTGATGGIGRAVAQVFSARGARLVLTGRDTRALAAIAAETGARAVEADLTSSAETAALAAQAGPVDVLVNVAGAGYLGALGAMTPDHLEELVAVNVTAPLALTASVLPAMLERGRGHIVLVGSVAGRVGRRREAVYAATKAAISVFADSLRAELLGTGVGVLLVTPGPVSTGFFEHRGAPYDRRWPRPVSPERVAAALADGVEAGAAEVTIPRWLSLPVRVRAAAPGVFRVLAARFD
jgi:short-subunit dehydrogenase